MGVTGLWKLLGPVGRPIALESLSNSILAIDSSIWLYQFQLALRDRESGRALDGAHIIGFFRRIMKLLFHGIKPVFVFDGDAPRLKRNTIAERKKRKTGATRDLAKTAAKLLAAQLRARSLNNELKQAAKEKEVEQEDTGEQIGDDAIYADDLLPDGNQRYRKENPEKEKDNVNVPTKKYVAKDQYALPVLDGTLESRAKELDPRITTELELKAFIQDLRPEDFDIDSKFFNSLPVEIKYEIIEDLRVKSRQAGKHQKRLDLTKFGGSGSVDSRANALDFSKSQIQHLMTRNSLTQKLFSVTDLLGKSPAAIDTKPVRVAGERNREYMLVKGDGRKGEGWILGTSNPMLNSKAPIIIEDDTASDDDGSSLKEATDSDEFEEVEILESKRPSMTPNARSFEIEEAIKSHYLPKQTPILDPYLDQLPNQASNSLFNKERSMSTERNLFAQGDEEEDEQLHQAIMESSRAQMSTADQLEEEQMRKAMYESELMLEASKKGKNSAHLDLKNSTPAVVFVGDDSDDSFEYVEIEPRAVAEKEDLGLLARKVIEYDSDENEDFEEVVPSSNITMIIKEPMVFQPPPPNPFSSPFSAAKSLPSTSAQLAPLATTASTTSKGQPVIARDFGLPIASTSSLEIKSTSIRASTLPPARPVKSLMDQALENNESSEEDDFGQEEWVPSSRVIAPPLASMEIIADKLDEKMIQVVEEMEKKILETEDSDEAMEMEEVENPTGIRVVEAEIEPEMTLEEFAKLVNDSNEVEPEEIDELDSGEDENTIPAEPEAVLEEPEPELAQELMSDVIKMKELEQLPSTEVVSQTSVAAVVVEDEEEFEEVIKIDKGKGRAVSPAPIPDELEDEDEEMIEWQKSPTPPPRATFTSEEMNREIERDEQEEELQDAEDERNMRKEEDEYAQLLSTLRNERLDNMRKEANADVEKLRAQANKDKRNADGVTQQMADDVKEMLLLFGIPFVDAPQEAEAECASLMQKKLVTGIITDDSDVFLFGGSRIFRNMFSQDKYVECYLSTDLEKELGLKRSNLINLAYLLGSDYVDGLKGIGPVRAREILAEFDGENGLEDFRDWWVKVQSGIDTKEDNDSPFKRDFKRKLKDLFIEPTWPNPAIAKAYYEPKVNTEDEPFSWAGPDLDGLRSYLESTLSWDAAKVDAQLLPLIKRQNDRKEGKIKVQANLGDYFDISAGLGPLPARQSKVGYESGRLQKVINSYRQSEKRKSGIISSDEEEAVAPEGIEEAPAPPKKKKQRSLPKASTSASRKRDAKARKAQNGESSDDFDQETGVTVAKERPPKRKASRKKKVVVVESDEDE